MEQPNNNNATALNTSINSSATPDIHATSPVDSSATSEKGWCYVGNYNGKNTCVEKNSSDICMSGDIFPSRDICINPALRGK